MHPKRRKLWAAVALMPVISIAVTPANADPKYWDLTPGADGAGATPTGVWDASTANWNTDSLGSASGTFSGWTTNTDIAVFSAGSDAVNAFTVTVSGTQTVGGLTVEEGTVTFATGVVALGTNTLTINNGAVAAIDSTSRFTATAGAKAILDGGTLRNTNTGAGSTFFTANAGIQVGGSTQTTGTIDVTSTTSGSSLIYTGVVSGNTLIKTGAGEFRVQGTNTYAKLIVKGGLFRLGNAGIEQGLGAVPASLISDQITLDGGSIGTSNSITFNANRGVKVLSTGTLFGNTGSTMTIAGPITGTGTLIAGLTSGSAVLNNDSNSVGGLTMTTGNITVGTFATGFLSGTSTASTVTVNSGKTLTAGSDNTSTSFAGKIAGSGAFTKTGNRRTHNHRQRVDEHRNHRDQRRQHQAWERQRRVGK